MMIIIQCDKCGNPIDTSQETPLTNGKFHVCVTCVKRHVIDNALLPIDDPEDPDDEEPWLEDAVASIKENQRKALFACGNDAGLHGVEEIRAFLGVSRISQLSEREAHKCINRLRERLKKIEMGEYNNV